MEALTPLSLPVDLLRTPNLQAPREQKALKELEGLFLHLLMKEMRKTVPENGLFGKSPAQQMFQEMLDEVYAQKMADSGQLGLAKLLEAQIRQQEKHDAAAEAVTGEFLPLNPLAASQIGPGHPLMDLKSFEKAADMFPVEP